MEKVIFKWLTKSMNCFRDFREWSNALFVGESDSRSIPSGNSSRPAQRRWNPSSQPEPEESR